MALDAKPVIIKKYANRRLYNTGTSKYVTLEDLADMVKAGEEFEVEDAKTGTDLTRSVLTQIIFEQEAKEGQNLLPISFLRQLIGYYGDTMQPMVPSYLEHTMNSFAAEQHKFRDQMKDAFGKMGMPGVSEIMPDMEQQVRQNMELFQNALGMFMPFTPPTNSEKTEKSEAEAENSPSKGEETGASEFAEMKKQIAEMQKKLNDLS